MCGYREPKNRLVIDESLRVHAWSRRISQRCSGRADVGARLFLSAVLVLTQSISQETKGVDFARLSESMKSD
jgi:hypothetical protein